MLQIYAHCLPAIHRAVIATKKKHLIRMVLTSFLGREQRDLGGHCFPLAGLNPNGAANAYPCVPSAGLACQWHEAGFVVRDLRDAAPVPSILSEWLLKEKDRELEAFLRGVFAGAEGDDVRVVVLPGQPRR